MSKNNEPKNVRCSFCGLPQESVKKIIAGPGVYICNECISLCQGILESDGLDNYYDEDYVEENEEKIPNPKEIKQMMINKNEVFHLINKVD